MPDQFSFLEHCLGQSHILQLVERSFLCGSLLRACQRLVVERRCGAESIGKTLSQRQLVSIIIIVVLLLSSSCVISDRFGVKLSGSTRAKFQLLELGLLVAVADH